MMLPAAKETTIVCPHCEKAYPLNEETLQEQPYKLPGFTNLVQIVLICPECQHLTHAYFHNPRLKRFQTTLELRTKAFQQNRTPGNLRQFQKAKRRYQAEFDRFQIEVKVAAGLA